MNIMHKIYQFWETVYRITLLNLLKKSIWHDVLFLIWSMHYNTFLTYQGSSMSVLNCKTQWIWYSTPQGVRSRIRNTFWCGSYIAVHIMVTDIKTNNLFFYWIRILLLKIKVYYMSDMSTFKTRKWSILKYFLRGSSTCLLYILVCIKFNHFGLIFCYKITNIVFFKPILRFFHLLILF